MSNTIFSPSGKYLLTITQKPTKPGCWNYSVGEVADIEKGGTTITTVNRNYSSFPYLFIEGHPNGHDYLVCGEDYQGQTVIELDTGKRRDHLPPEAEKGHAFCWAAYEFDVASKLLVVDGCHWACPYEFRFYDFSDPMNGWPQLETNEYIDADDGKKPEINGDVIKTFETAVNDVDDDEEEGKEKEVASIKTFKREGNKLIFQDEWVSDNEKVRRQKRKEAEERYQAEMKLFKETDPLYLTYKEKLKEWPKADSHHGIGVTYDGWCPDFKVQERRWCHRIHFRGTPSKYEGWTIDLEWAMYTGPVKLVIFKDGKSHETKFYSEHSVKSMEEAFAYAKMLVGDERCDG